MLSPAGSREDGGYCGIMRELPNEPKGSFQINDMTKSAPRKSAAAVREADGPGVTLLVAREPRYPCPFSPILRNALVIG
jgi:hypothetical protein